MSGFFGAPFLTPQTFHRPSFLVGFAVAKIWNEYSKAYVDDKRRAALALGDYLWRLSEAWQKASSNEDAVRIATKIRFRLIDLKKARASLAVIEMEREYDKLLASIRRIIERKHPLSAGAKRSALVFEINKVLPQVPHSQVLKWDEAGLSASGIAYRAVAEKYKSQPSTVKRLLSQTKQLSITESLRRDWLQKFNTSDAVAPVEFDEICDYFIHRLVPLVPLLRELSRPSSIPGRIQPNPNVSLIPHSLLSK